MRHFQNYPLSELFYYSIVFPLSLFWSEMTCSAQKHTFSSCLSALFQVFFFFLTSNCYICPIHNICEWIWMLLKLLIFFFFFNEQGWFHTLWLKRIPDAEDISFGADCRKQSAHIYFIISTVLKFLI